MDAHLQERVEALLDFWFGARGSAERGQPQARWYAKDAVFDAACRSGFGADLDAAIAGAWEAARETPDGALALTLLLDQIPRNLFRGSPRAFATDPRAREVSAAAIDRGFDRVQPPVLRRFFYLPFEHSESLEDQRRSVALFRACASEPNGPETLDYAERHLRIIERFGRFPHRNEVLGRISTDEERRYLQEGGERF